jgi:sphinganine C4-monooxygenase
MSFAEKFFASLPSADVRTWGAAEFSVVAPLVVHWALALVYECFDTFGLFQQYKLLQPEEYRKNKVTKLEVVRGVLVNQVIILIVGLVGLAVEPEMDSQTLSDPFGITQTVLNNLVDSNYMVRQSPVLTSLAYATVVVARMVAAMFVYDTWQYWVHLVLHMKWAYRKST